MSDLDRSRPMLGPVAASLGFLVLTACLTDGSQPITGGLPADIEARAVATDDPRARLILGQDVLLGRIKLDNPRFRKVGKFTQAAVQVVNQSQDRFELEYRVVWRDDDDFEVSSGSWRRFVLAGYEDKAIQTTANRPEGSRVTVTVRLPDEVVR
ncbi:MAG: DUF1425 domain-containing protein [Geminicoccaceae bacterium]